MLFLVQVGNHCNHHSSFQDAHNSLPHTISQKHIQHDGELIVSVDTCYCAIPSSNAFSVMQKARPQVEQLAAQLRQEQEVSQQGTVPFC